MIGEEVTGCREVEGVSEEDERNKKEQLLRG